jgi:hypothetical protein
MRWLRELRELLSDPHVVMAGLVVIALTIMLLAALSAVTCTPGAMLVPGVSHDALAHG